MAVPHELTPYIDRWLQVHRFALRSIANADSRAGSVDGHLRLEGWGKPMSAKAIQRQVWWRTRQAFGKGIYPQISWGTPTSGPPASTPYRPTA